MQSKCVKTASHTIIFQTSYMYVYIPADTVRQVINIIQSGHSQTK